MARKVDLVSNEEWLEWGKRDPLWGVASWKGRERAGANPWTDSEFYDLGDDWLDFDKAWNDCGSKTNGLVLEIGCGAGRITSRLAKSFDSVIASDISPDILAYAKERVSAQNVEWTITSGSALPAATASVDAVFSCHVLQHLPDNDTQLGIFREMFRILRPGGTFFVHLPIHIFPELNVKFSQLARVGYWTFQKFAKIRFGIRRHLMHLGGVPYMRGVSYEMKDLIEDLRMLGFLEVKVSLVIVRTNGMAHTCVYGRKP